MTSPIASAAMTALRTTSHRVRAPLNMKGSSPAPSATIPPREPVSTTERPSRARIGATSQRGRSSGRSAPYWSPSSTTNPAARIMALLLAFCPRAVTRSPPPPDRMGGPRDPHHRQEGADGAGERQDNHGESSDARGLKQIIRGPEHQHGLQQQGEQLGDLSSIISVVHVRGGGVACVPHSGNGKRVQVQ